MELLLKLHQLYIRFYNGYCIDGLSKGTMMDSEFRSLHLWRENVDKELVTAAADGDLVKVQHCLKNGANAKFISKVENCLNIEDLVYKSTALMEAAHHGHLQIVIILLQHLKNHDERRVSTYWTVLVETLRNCALRNSSHHLFNCHSDRELPLDELQRLNEFSLMFEHFNIMKYLIEEGVDVNNLLRNGKTPLMIASSIGSTTKMQYLLDHGADVNLLIHGNTNSVKSALICAVKRNQMEAISLLLNNGVKMDLISSQLAFFIAISRGLIDVINLLVHHGARPVMIKAYDLYTMSLIELEDIALYSDRVSPLYMALYSNQSNIACHFLSIGFVTDFDVTSLKKQKYLLCRLQEDDSYSEALEILDSIKSQPMPLTILCFVDVLESLSKSKHLAQSIDCLNIPKGMKSRLMFGRSNV